VVIRSRPATARTAKTRPAYAIDSVDHALRLAAMLQLEGALTVSDAADRLGVARSTAHRVLAMLVYRDFAVQGSDRRYHAGPVLELATHSRSLTARLRTVAMPHLEGLVAVLGESANLIIRTGDRARFIASAESTQALRVEQREGMVFPAHLVSGGLVLLAEAGEAEVTALYAGGVAGWVANCIDADMPVLQENIESLKTRLPVPCLGVVPFLVNPIPEQVASCFTPAALDHLIK